MEAALQVEIDELFDPLDTASVFLHLMAQQFERRELVLIVHSSFEGLKGAREGTPLMPMFDPACYSGGTGFWLEGRDRDGKTVLNHAVRVYKFWDRSLADMWNSLEFLYAPVSRRAPGEACVCSAPMAHRIKGTVVYSGALWISPAWRGRKLGGLLPQITRVLAFARWRQDFTIAVVEDDIRASGVVESCGYHNIEPAIVWEGSQSYGAQWLNLAWMDQAELKADLFNRLTLTAAA